MYDINLPDESCSRLENETRPEHEGSAHLPSLTNLLFEIMAIMILDLGWITARQASLLIG
jgi:hypothetical protein